MPGAASPWPAASAHAPSSSSPPPRRARRRRLRCRGHALPLEASVRREAGAGPGPGLVPPRRHARRPRVTALATGTVRVFRATEVARFRAEHKYTAFRVSGTEHLLEESLDALEVRLKAWGCASTGASFSLHPSARFIRAGRPRRRSWMMGSARPSAVADCPRCASVFEKTEDYSRRSGSLDQLPGSRTGRTASAARRRSTSASSCAMRT
jgi:hypothetical protein